MDAFDLRLEEIKTLKINLERMKKRVQEIEEIIKIDGVSGYYSINADITVVASDIHMNCFKLAMLRELATDKERLKKKE